MTDEDKVLNFASEMAEAITSIHFHNEGYMDDQVPPETWSDYEWRVRDAILNTAEKWMD